MTMTILGIVFYGVACLLTGIAAAWIVYGLVANKYEDIDFEDEDMALHIDYLKERYAHAWSNYIAGNIKSGTFKQIHKEIEKEVKYLEDKADRKLRTK